VRENYNLSPELETSLTHLESPEMKSRGVHGEVAEILSNESGIDKTNIYYLLSVRENRPDLSRKCEK